MALSPVFLLLLLPLLPRCASEKGCLWGRGVETEPPLGAEIRPPPHSLRELGGAEKRSNRDLSVPLQVRARQACSPVLSSVLSGEPVQMFKHPVKSFLPKATEISDHTASCTTHSCFSQSPSTLRHLKENSFCVLLGKYGQKRKKKENRNSL